VGGTIFPSGDKTISEVPALDDNKEHEVRMTLSLGLPVLPRVAKPVVIISDGTATMTCATQDAEIWVSANGLWPTPETPGAWRYENPIETQGIADLRVVAYHPDMQPSEDVWE
jgi:hypothetical protein